MIVENHKKKYMTELHNKIIHSCLLQTIRYLKYSFITRAENIEIAVRTINKHMHGVKNKYYLKHYVHELDKKKYGWKLEDCFSSDKREMYIGCIL